MGMADLPDAAYSRLLRRPIYGVVAEAASVEDSNREVTIMNVSNQDFRKSIEGVVSARNREATRQIVRTNEFQLIGAFTKRPN